MSIINFPRTYPLNEEYESIKQRLFQVLGECSKDIINFNDSGKNVTFISERLIPVCSLDRPRVLLLFSNPHPQSIRQGMFLSPSVKGQKSLFWSTMKEAGLLTIENENLTAKQLADICLNSDYNGPFEFIFYCYYAFPTAYPEDICKIFGKNYFNQIIEPEAINEFRKTVLETSAEAVVTFNKGIFNLVSENKIENYINRLREGELIQSMIQKIDKNVPIFLTYPTGWRYHKEYSHLRKASLELIKKAIYTISTNN